MSRTINLLCLFGIFAILFIDHAEPHSARRLEGEGIQGGNNAEEGQFPHQISLELDGESVCGGSILSERFVVTAAHCAIDDYNRFMNQPLKVIAGISNLESRLTSRVAVNVVKVYVPKEYDSTVLEDGVVPSGDIAILELNEDLDLAGNSKLGRVKLPKNNENNYIGKDAIISGFGLNEVDLFYDVESLDYIEINGRRDNNLRFAKAKVMSHETCQNSYGDSLQLNKVTHLCAALYQRDENRHEGLCTGDSGGGLIYDGIMIGVVNKSPNGCREIAKPAIYARVSHYLSFINNVLNGEIDDNIRTTTLDTDS